MVERRPASLLHLHQFSATDEDAGALHHRVTQPSRLLEGHADLAPTAQSWRAPDAPELALAADVLVIHALAGIEIETLIRERRRLRRPTLFEIGDDLSALRHGSRRGANKPNPIDVGRQCLHASLADGVQFSSNALQMRYAQLNARTAVLDNAVEFPANVVSRPNGFVFGWAGTRSHQPDLEALVPAITAFCARRPNAKFALMGHAALASLFSALSPSQFHWQPFGSYAEYRAFFGTLHVGLVPIADGAFGRGRTDVKAIEMAAEGAAVLAQSAPALTNLPAIVPRFDDGETLSALLDALYSNPKRVERLAQETRKMMQVQRGVAGVRARHVTWYRSWLGSRTGPLVISEQIEQTLQLSAALEIAGNGDHAEALAMVCTLLDANPSYQQARWLAVRLLTKLRQPAEALALGAPLQLCPIHRHVWSSLALTLGGAEDHKARSSLPLGSKMTVSHAERETYHTALLATHPYHPFALAAEEYRLRQVGDVAAATTLQERRALLGDAT